MSELPVVRKFAIKTSKSLLGAISYKVAFECPKCRARLSVSDEEIGGVDFCPDCGLEFIVSTDARRLLRDTQDEATARAKAEENAKAEQRAAADHKRKLEDEREKEILRIERAKQEKEAFEQKAAEKLTALKEHERSKGIRQYPALRSLETLIKTYREIISVLCRIGVGGVLLCYLVVAWTPITQLFQANGRFVGDALVRLVIPTIGAVYMAGFFFLVEFSWSLICKIIEESIRLMINIAQDTERILVVHEHSQGRPWTKE